MRTPKESYTELCRRAFCQEMAGCFSEALTRYREAYAAWVLAYEQAQANRTLATMGGSGYITSNIQRLTRKLGVQS